MTDEKTKGLILSTLAHVKNMQASQDQEFAGYHRFRTEDGAEYGSFKVYHLDEEVPTADEPYTPGWYWQSEFPGCLPDGDAFGPFPTAEGAYLDAIKE